MIFSSNAEIPASVGTFAQIAEEFCALIDAREQYTADQLLGHVHVLLPRLYSAALALPTVSHERQDDGDAEEPGEGEEDDNEEEYHPAPDFPALMAAARNDPERERQQAIYRALGRMFGAMDCYAEIFDPYAEPGEEAVTGMLSDDLADIYADLTDGLAKWRRGEQDEATWAWRFSFGTHWGEHATGALRALYTLAARHGLSFPRLDGGLA